MWRTALRQRLAAVRIEHGTCHARRVIGHQEQCRACTPGDQAGAFIDTIVSSTTDVWSAEIQGMDHETIDAQAANSGEALKALNRLREALQTLPFFGAGKVVWWQNCSFLGDDRTGGAQAVTAALSELAQELKTFSWQGVRLLVSAGKVDKRKTFYKTLEKLGPVESFIAWSDDKDWAAEAESTALRALKARKKEITDEGLAAAFEALGS